MINKAFKKYVVIDFYRNQFNKQYSTNIKFTTNNTYNTYNNEKSILLFKKNIDEQYKFYFFYNRSYITYSFYLWLNITMGMFIHENFKNYYNILINNFNISKNEDKTYSIYLEDVYD